MDKTVSFIRVASDWGAGRKGAALGPESIVQAGLRHLTSLGIDCEDAGEIKSALKEPPVSTEPVQRHDSRPGTYREKTETFAPNYRCQYEAVRTRLLYGRDRQDAVCAGRRSQHIDRDVVRSCGSL